MLLGGSYTGEILIDSMNFARSEYYVSNDLWDEGGAYLNEKAKRLEAAGASFILCVSNTWHRAAQSFMKGLSIPLLHIVDPTGNAIRVAKLQRVALLGTKPVMSTPFLIDEFSNRFGIEIVVPEEAEQNYINRIIFDEMSKGIFSDDARRGYLDIVDRLRDRGVDGIVLGCTEIPLLINQADRPDLPMFDTLKLHAQAAAAKALEVT
jgi:aspartate racemase